MTRSLGHTLKQPAGPPLAAAVDRVLFVILQETTKSVGVVTDWFQFFPPATVSYKIVTGPKKYKNENDPRRGAWAEPGGLKPGPGPGVLCDDPVGGAGGTDGAVDAPGRRHPAELHAGGGPAGHPPRHRQPGPARPPGWMRGGRMWGPWRGGGCLQGFCPEDNVTSARSGATHTPGDGNDGDVSGR